MISFVDHFFGEFFFLHFWQKSQWKFCCNIWLVRFSVKKRLFLKKCVLSLSADTCCKPFCWQYIYFFLWLDRFISARNSVKDRKYIDGDMNVVELVIFRRALFVCSHASLFTFISFTYSEVLKDVEQVLWFASWKQSVVIDIDINLFSSLLYPYSFAKHDASYIMWGL